MEFKDKLKELRTSIGGNKKINQATVAQAIGVDRSTYSKYETGDSEPDFETVRKLADFFNVSIDYLLGREHSQKREFEKQESYEATLTEKDRKEIKQQAEHIKNSLMSSVGLAFDGKADDEETLVKIMQALEEGLSLAKKEAKEKYTPKKYRNKKE
ncbi:DNA-binding transcriptional regulator, XRE-family HTH domain [Anaerovirgula multivorans]|uniref:DNA-binding transcriptional regulator, XRE-family HTH domain n=1 Tax=Anaerovirgula multivorans TaxID=312168 RepID=A0A239D8A9_9FIRM|nr:helix-turn-helix transcriptional regulator [Anaerovirgula multivorans]SNS28104.1 DNA-binding transcriptional regulator, XRE-family HTH domain [Anaerovirgula multivorans]